MSVTKYTIKQIFSSSLFDYQSHRDQKVIQHRPTQPKINLLKPLRRWLNHIEVNNPKLAHWVCQLIPAQCPLHRQIKLFGHTLISIPPLCKLNPFYEEIMTLRFRAISYLADQCGEDVSAYC